MFRDAAKAELNAQAADAYAAFKLYRDPRSIAFADWLDAEWLRFHNAVEVKLPAPDAIAAPVVLQQWAGGGQESRVSAFLTAEGWDADTVIAADVWPDMWEGD